MEDELVGYVKRCSSRWCPGDFLSEEQGEVVAMGTLEMPRRGCIDGGPNDDHDVQHGLDDHASGFGHRVHPVEAIHSLALATTLGEYDTFATFVPSRDTPPATASTVSQRAAKCIQSLALPATRTPIPDHERGARTQPAW